MNEDEEIIIRSLHAISKLMPKTETKEHIEHLFKRTVGKFTSCLFV